MTVEADLKRTRRQAFAAPGGSLDRMVRLLAIGLPALVGVVAALMIITPLGPRGEISFILDRNRVDIAEDRLRVDNAVYRGEDDEGRPFSLPAGEAVQHSASVPVVRMRDQVARIMLTQGPAVLQAEAGRYDFDAGTVAVDSQVTFAAADGYRMTARGVSIDLRQKTLVGSNGVEGSVPAGTFSADAMRADLSARTFALIGNARLRMVPGQMQLPQ